MRRWSTLGLVLLAACGGSPAGLTALTPRADPPAPTSVATAAPTTAPRPTTTTAAPTTTTRRTTTTLPPLPVPVPPPVEDGTTDPRVELGRIGIPRLGLDRPLYEGIRLSTLDLGPGHWPGTAMPGELGNVVVAGHRVSHNEDFRQLDQLVPGDEVIFHTGQRRHVYEVRSTEIVGPDALWIVAQSYARTATLFACHPPGSVAQRIVVHLEMRA